MNKLVVDNEYRRRGIAHLLVNELNTVLSGRNLKPTGALNTAAVLLLENTGWTAAGQIVGLLPMDQPELFYHRDLWPAAPGHDTK